MSVTVNGRILQAILKVNTGDPNIDGTELDISNLIISLGELNWSVDENLTKLSVGNLTLNCTDDSNNTLQNFLESNLTSAKGLLPPWLFLYVDGNIAFTGLIYESPVVSQSGDDLNIELSVINWATMLTYKYIQGDDQAFSRLSDFRQNVAFVAGSTINAYSAYNKELRRGHYTNMAVVDASNLGQFNVGDWVYFNNYSTYQNYNQKYQIIGIQNQGVDGLASNLTLCLWLGSGFAWQNAGKKNYGQQSTLYRVYTSTSNVADTVTYLPKFIANENWPIGGSPSNNKSTIFLTYTDGLMPGDTLNMLVTGTASPASVTITDVDNINNVIYLTQAINFNLAEGVTSFELSLDSLQTATLQPLMPLVDKALIGVASSDFSRFSPTTTPNAALSFISPDSFYGQNTYTERLTGVSLIRPTLTDFEVRGPQTPTVLSWHGLPASGWIAETANSYVETVPWTDHQATPPTFLLPILPVQSDGPSRVVPGNIHNPSSWDVPSATDPYYIFVYDYSTYRGFTFRFAGGKCTNAGYQTFNGTAWSSSTALATTGVAIPGVGIPLSILPLYGSSSSIGSGCGLLGLYLDGTLKTLFTSTTQSTLSLPPDAWLTATPNSLSTSLVKYLSAGLTLTSNGIYYSTPSGYGYVTVNASGVLSQAYCNLFNIQSLTNLGGSTITSVAPLIGNMVYANSEIQALVNITYQAAGVNQNSADTYFLRLNPVPQSTALASCYSAAYLLSSLPRTGMMVKSPVSEDVFGFLGSRLFLISKTLPTLVERFTPVNQTAQSLIEFITTITNSVAAPSPEGVLHIISRDFPQTPTNLNIDMVSVKTSRWNKHMADTIVIKGENGSLGVAVSSTQLAGLTISYQNNDWIKNSSQAQAIADSYLAFFGEARHEVEQEWFSSVVPAPWENLSPFTAITINGGSTSYLLTGLSFDVTTQKAKANLLELL